MADVRVEAVVRLVHVLAMAIMVGGAALLWTWFRRAVPQDAPPAAVSQRFERWFWGAAGLIVMTGVGNVGALGDGFPRLGSPAGWAFAFKFALVLALLVVSILRTLIVSRLAAVARPWTVRALRGLASWYGATALLGGGIAGIGVLAAHGAL